MLPWTLFLTVQMSAVIEHLNSLHGKEIVKYLFKYRSHNLHGNLLQTSTMESKNCNPPEACMISKSRWVFRRFLVLKYYNFYMTAWQYKCIAICKRHLRRNTFTHITLRFFESFLWINITLWSQRNKDIHTKIIPFSENTSKIKII